MKTFKETKIGERYEYFASDYFYNSNSGYGWGKIMLYNNQVAMIDMSDKDIENIRLNLEDFVSGIEKYIKENRYKYSDIGIPFRKGSNNANAKLSLYQVGKIRELYKTGEYTYQKLGDIYGITHQAVQQIVKGKTYK